VSAAVIIVLDNGETGHAPDAGKLAAMLPVDVEWARREVDGTVTCLAVRVTSPESFPVLQDKARQWAASNGWAATVAEIEERSQSILQGQYRAVMLDVCTCDHRRDLHADRFAPGHGQCMQAGCRCPQFTWAGRVTT
jgi:hypothetical protein